jgi:hypothetical protein
MPESAAKNSVNRLNILENNHKIPAKKASIIQQQCIFGKPRPKRLLLDENTNAI